MRVLAACCISLLFLPRATGQEINDVITRAFAVTHDGWSSDEVLLRDDLRQKFVRACLVELPDASPDELTWRLLNLRKAGKLRIQVTRRRQDDHSAYRHLAEIVARTLQDKHGVTTDRMMCNTKYRADFDAQSRTVAAKVDPYLMRKAAFGLRKARRLRPELVLRIANWQRSVSTHRAEAVVNDRENIPATPGIYILRDPSGYLYIGESINLQKRLLQHLDESDRQSLANYLRQHGIQDLSIEIHAFPKKSRARQVAVRRAYESELIASRKPRFNVRP